MFYIWSEPKMQIANFKDTHTHNFKRKQKYYNSAKEIKNIYS